ncbi:MAG: Mpv17/PMP22 family protein [Kiritimatiellae bacterium]|nr:Mpv17/PMP22 family protein [Kiritimatiellia bacterium]
MKDHSVYEEALRSAAMSVKANRMPMLVLWTLAIALVVAYDRFDAVAAALEPLARWQTQGGFAAAVLNRIAFCALLPGVFLFTIPSIRPPRPAATVLAYAAWGAAWGVLCDLFFTLQANVFGDGRDFATVAAKTLIDQLLWTALFCTPLNTLFFAWVASGFRRIPIAATLRTGFLPMLFVNWIVWWPVSAVVYMFPLPLQIQLVGLAGACWMLAALAAGTRKKGTCP